MQDIAQAHLVHSNRAVGGSSQVTMGWIKKGKSSHNSYFLGEALIYDKNDFDRHFQVPRADVICINQALSEKGIFVQKFQLHDGSPGIHPLCCLVGLLLQAGIW